MLVVIVGQGYANPNANLMLRPQILSMENQGLWIVNGSQFRLQGGSMEGCGSAGDITFRGIYVQGGVSDGTVGLFLDGFYIESNSGYPVYIVHSSNRSMWVKIHDCNFNNGSSTRYPVSQVLLLGEDYTYPENVTCRLEMRGNNCQGYGYTPSTSRPDVNITGYSANQCLFLDYDNTWIPNQQPFVDSDVFWKTSPDASFRGVIDGTSALVSNRKNIVSATKTATGVYTLTVNHIIDNDVAQVTVYGAVGYGIVSTPPAGNTLIVRTYNASGVATDMSFYVEGLRTSQTYTV